MIDSQLSLIAPRSSVTVSSGINVPSVNDSNLSVDFETLSKIKMNH